MPTKIDEDVPRLLLELGFLSLRRGLMPEALAMFEAVRALRPGHATPQMFIGIWHFAKGSYADAERTYRAILKTHQDHPLASAHLGEALIAQKRWSEAEAVLGPVAKQTAEADAGRFASELLTGLRAGIFQRAL